VGKPLRIALVALGLAVAVYGAASLTGGWLGEPPWWTEHPDLPEWSGNEHFAKDGTPYSLDGGPRLTWDESFLDESFDVESPRQPWPWISAGVVVAGLALAAFAAWPRRAKPTPPA
jgi:hypothetical protein